MKIIALFCALTLWPAQLDMQYLAPGVATVAFLHDSQGTWPIVTVLKDAAKADQVIVQTFYHQDIILNQTNAQTTTLLRSRTSIIPYLPESAVAADPIPTEFDKIAWVKVTLVKNVAVAEAAVKF